MLSRTLFYIFVLCCASIFSNGQRGKKFFRKDYTFIESTEAFYKVHTLHKSWLEAKTQCAFEGASLFYPEDENEANAVISFWTSSQSFHWIFVGISDLLVKGVFETIDGRPVSTVYNRWAPAEPNNANGNEDCVILRKDGHYNDERCDPKYPYVCKKKYVWNTLCNIPDADYRYSHTLGRCYKLHRKPLSWLAAYAVCAAEQSYLTVINSPAEAEFVVRLAQEVTITKAPPGYISGAIHSGFHNRLGEGWQTSKGIPLEDSGYDCWDENQPGDGVGRCGSIFRNGRLHSISCDTISSFVCEHDVDILSAMFDDRIGNTTIN